MNFVDPYGLSWFGGLGALFDSEAWGQLAHDLFHGDDQPPPLDPDSQQALANAAGVGNTPLTDDDGRNIQPGDMLENNLANSALDVLTMAIPVGPEGEGAAAAAEKALKEAEDLAKAAKKGIKCKNGTKITGFAKHGIDRAIGDAAKRAGVKPDSILDALKNPEKIVTGTDEQGRPYERFYGQDARVVVNPQTGQIVSVKPLSGAGAQ